MNCESYITLLDEYLNNELEEKIHGSVSAHLGKCEACREEIRLLRFESGLYQKIDNLRERNFTDQWDAMRTRLVSESLIADKAATTSKEVEKLSLFSLFPAFLTRIENLFLTNKAAFGIFLLVVLSVVTVFILSKSRNSSGEIAAVKTTAEVSKPETNIDKRENNTSAPEKVADSDETEFIRKSVKSSAKTTLETTFRVSPANFNRTKNISLVSRKKFEKTESRLESPKNQSSADSKYAVSVVPAENLNNDLNLSPDEKNLTSHLNKVHLFLLMFRNLENDKALNTIIGDKYQTEARMFLDANNNFIKTSLRNKNIPAVELLREIEPVLEAISNLNEENGGNKIGNVAAMVRQTGIVFKMRLWMSNIKSVREQQS